MSQSNSAAIRRRVNLPAQQAGAGAGASAGANTMQQA